MTEPCDFCGGPCNPFDQSTWKQVVGWVGGPRKDSMRLREDTNKYAHNACVAKAQSGIDPKSQPTLEDDGTVPSRNENASVSSFEDPLPEDLFTSTTEEVPRDEPSFLNLGPIDQSGTPF